MVASGVVGLGVVGSSDVGKYPDPDTDPDSKRASISGRYLNIYF